MKTDTTVAVGMWRPVTARLRDWLLAVPQLQHFSTERFRRRRGEGLEQGESVWSMADEDKSIAIYFNWAEISAGVVALADPMAVFSNVVLVDDDDAAELSVFMAAVYFNQALYDIDWRAPVRERLEQWRKVGPGVGLPVPRFHRRRYATHALAPEGNQTMLAA